MAESSGFKHITLAPDDEDDFVIRAGARAASVDGAESDTATPVAMVASAPVETADESAGAVDAVDEALPPDADVTASVQDLDRESTSIAAKDSGYRSTTLDDLSSAPMPGLQKGILIVALMVVMAAVVYYLAFMQ